MTTNGHVTNPFERPPVPDYTPDSIVERYRMHESATQALRQRFDDDYDLWKLLAYKGGFPGASEEAIANEKGYRHYTSSRPRNVANKLISWIAQSQMLVRCAAPLEDERIRRINSLKESFAIGLIEQANERFENLMEPPLIDQLAWFACVRGMIFGRAILVRDEQGRTHVDITPWDPRHITWGLGANGLEWVCYRKKKTRLEILTEYGVDLPDADETRPDSGKWVYDYYDNVANTVVVEDRFLKEPIWHGSLSIPVFAAVSGFHPVIDDPNDSDHSGTYSESIFEAMRDTNDQQNFLMSVYLELAGRLRKPGHDIFSRDGSLTIEEDINKEGTDVSLSTANDEQIVTREGIRVPPDFANLIGLVSAEIQQASLPNSTFGELAFQLSGFAISQLNQDIISKLAPRVRVVESALKQITNKLADQFATGFFEPLTLSGVGRNRQYFHQAFFPQMIAAGGNYAIKLVPRLPRDDATRVQMAQLMRQGPVPLAPDIYIWDEILEIQDVDNFDDRIKAQQAERTSPMAVLFEMMQAAINQNKPELAQIYFGEILKLMIAQQFQFGVPPTVSPPGSPEAGSPGAQSSTRSSSPGPGFGVTGPGTGVSPEVTPPEAFGINSRPNMQAGPNVPPGSPRPGRTAENNLQRLGSIGLVGPGG